MLSLAAARRAILSEVVKKCRRSEADNVSSEIKERNRRRICRFVEILQRRDRRNGPAAAATEFLHSLLAYHAIRNRFRRIH
ncbi:MAG TPA: hypothetical protein VNC50_04490, partial [Planctomycetia bacterium]|nr:hypothetical protein [Planctomycetia bacterium]